MRLDKMYPGAELTLAAAVIHKAIDDYKEAVKTGNRRKYDGAVGFFRRPWGDYLLSFFFGEKITGAAALRILERQVGFDEETFNRRCEEYEKRHQAQPK